MGRFIALRELTANGGGKLQPGDVIPDAEKWPHHIMHAEVNVGHVFDLRGEITLKKDGRAAQSREAGLLLRLRSFGKEVVASETHPGQYELRQVQLPDLTAAQAAAWGEEQARLDDAMKALKPAPAPAPKPAPAKPGKKVNA